ncbi:MAG: recombination mediator protein UvsY [Methylophagaceae bacterium]|jgi:hypothetical protein|tara:strand:+ start:488 stop:925 length:438 start_codon:yes stop_codon:yes gene_type:complete
MDTNDISALWAVDCIIDETNLVGEARRIPQMHSKYYNLYYKEVLRVKKLKSDYTSMHMLKREYYDGSMSEEELKRNGWRPYQLKVLRADLDKYIQADKDVIKMSLTIDFHTANANYLEDIIKTLHSRNFIIKSMIDVLKFQAGDY